MLALLRRLSRGLADRLARLLAEPTWASAWDEGFDDLDEAA